MPGDVIRVLVVEDSPTDALLIRTVLARGNGDKFEITEVDRLAAAMDAIREHDFDVVLLDLALPDSQGLETYHSIRSISGHHIPAVLVVSGLVDEAVAVAAVKAGAQDYLLKSNLIGDSLSRSIRYAIARQRAQEQIAQYAWELRTKNKELEDELRMAREIQQALLPHQYPRFANGVPSLGDTVHFSHCYRPATSLSGDFFDVLHLSDTEAGVFLCDVMGHGPRAALIGALTRGLIEQLRPVASRPGYFLTELNQSLAAILNRAGIHAFVTAFYLVADLKHHHVRYANAGHPSPLHLRRESKTVDRLYIPGATRNPPLGLLAHHDYPTNEMELTGNDTILMFTDGLYEAENPQNEIYSRQRLLEAVRERVDLPSEQLFAALVADVQNFSGKKDFDDDVCLVGIDITRAASPSKGFPQMKQQRKSEESLVATRSK